MYIMTRHMGKTDWWGNFGEKVRQGAQIAGHAKTIWDVGKTIYGGLQAVAPYAETALALL